MQLYFYHANDNYTLRTDVGALRIVVCCGAVLGGGAVAGQAHSLVVVMELEPVADGHLFHLVEAA